MNKRLGVFIHIVCISKATQINTYGPVREYKGAINTGIFKVASNKFVQKCHTNLAVQINKAPQARKKVVCQYGAIKLINLQFFSTLSFNKRKQSHRKVLEGQINFNHSLYYPIITTLLDCSFRRCGLKREVVVVAQ